MVIVVLMGVCGCGKTTVGQALSARFLDADDWHSADSRNKMARGVPLTDKDRGPWLESLGSLLVQWAHTGVSGVLACSALKRSYRDLLTRKLLHDSSSKEHKCVFILLNGTADVLAARMAGRCGHFMSPHLLQSQLETLEPLSPDELGMSCDVDHQTVDEIVDYVYNQIKAQ